MISILIPVYNYSIVDLVKTLHNQLTEAKTPFEVICLDDGSDASYKTTNSSIDQLSNTSYTLSSSNQGRISTRQLLSEKASYDWLLFLDADVMPKHSSYIANYLTLTTSRYDVIFGGFAYHDTPPENDFLLRWKYGRAQEESLALQRNKKPYKVVISANFLIRKKIFQKVNSKIKKNSYGLDNYFGSILKADAIPVFHIDNEVYHLGIEKSEVYLQKKEQAADTLLELIKSKRITEHDNSLLALFLTLKKYKLHYLFSLFFKVFKRIMRSHLLGANPSIKMLQIYRISYMCNAYISMKN